MTTDRDPDIYYSALMKLASITAAVQGQLYTSRLGRIKRDYTHQKQEKMMKQLDSQLRKWKQRLPEILDFDREHEDQMYIRQVSKAPRDWLINILIRHHRESILHSATTMLLSLSISRVLGYQHLRRSTQLLITAPISVSGLLAPS